MNYYIDIHTHSYYRHENTRLLLNVFPKETEKFEHPCYFSVGLHPWYINEGSVEMNLEWVEKQMDNPRVLAIGEIGFDKTIEVSREDQEYVFKRQADLAEKLHKPVIIHCVRSYNELIEYRNTADQQIPWIFHWFNASAEIARELIRRNCYLSFGHLLFNENSKACRIFPDLPGDSLLLETDDAGISIQEITERAALIRGISLHSLLQIINRNFTKCFRNL